MTSCTRKRRNGGASYPAKYYNAHASVHGGTRRRRRNGGFVPSIMEGFAVATSKYIAPLALFAGYKMFNRSKTSHKKRHSKRYTQKIRR
jgi:hypothetical protein